MKLISPQELCYTDIDFEIYEIFPESWGRRKEFSLYKTNPRPCSAFFFVCGEIDVTFYPTEYAPVTAGKGDAVFIPAGSTYHVSVNGEPNTQIVTYTVNLKLMDATRAEIAPADRIAVLSSIRDPMPETRLKKLCEAFHSNGENTNGKRYNYAKTKAEFFLLLDLIAESLSQNRDSYYPVRKGIDAFCDEWNQNEKIEKYAQLCGVSVTYFYRCFRKWAGKSPVEYRNDLRLSHAENLLRCTDMRVSEIAETVGYEDPFYFCRLFTAHFGISPHGYRKHAPQNEHESLR